MKWSVVFLAAFVAGCNPGNQSNPSVTTNEPTPVFLRYKNGLPTHPYPLLFDPPAVTNGAMQPEIVSGSTLVTVGGVSITNALLTIQLAGDEALWGFGERFDALNMRGHAIETWVVEPWGGGGKSYFAVPFFISSKGYGLFVNCTGRVKFDCGATNPEELRIWLPEAGTDVFVFHGTPREIVEQYTQLVGRPQPVPDWFFQPWISRNSYLSEYEIDRVIDKMDEYHLKAGAVVLEAWAQGLQNFKFEERRYPNPKEWIAKLHARGYHVLCWETPSLWDSASTYPEAKKNGYLVLNPDGTELRVDWLENAVKMDFRKAAARDWWTKLHEPLIEMGVDGFKTDGGERAPDPWFHNVHPYYYQRAVLDAFKALGKSNGVTFARSASAPCAGNVAFWAGDQNSTWNEFPKVVRAGVTAALSGFSLWGHDIGGYAGTPTKKLYIRWLELGAFSPIMQMHGTTPREPWFYDDETLRIAKFYFDVRAALQPYILATAKESFAHGTPILRPLLWAFPDDRATWDIDDEFLFGDDLLVAPVLGEPDDRKIYLPAGEWVDAWTKQSYSGPRTITYHADLSVIPVLIKKASIAKLDNLLPALLRDDRGEVVIDLGGATNERGIVPPQRVVRGQPYEKVFLAIRNRGVADVSGDVSLGLPEGFSALPGGTQHFTAPAQGEGRVAFYISWPDSLPVGSYPIETRGDFGPVPVTGPMVTLVKPPHWHVLGLFSGGVGSSNALDRAAVDLNKYYTGRDGREVHWQEVNRDAVRPDGYVDFGKVIGENGGSTCFGYATIDSPEPKRARFLVGSGDALTIWLNGQQVFQKLAHRSPLVDEDAVDVDLRQGANDVLVKISRDIGPNGLYFRVVSGDEK